MVVDAIDCVNERSPAVVLNWSVNNPLLLPKTSLSVLATVDVLALAKVNVVVFTVATVPIAMNAPVPEPPVVNLYTVVPAATVVSAPDVKVNAVAVPVVEVVAIEPPIFLNPFEDNEIVSLV